MKSFLYLLRMEGSQRHQLFVEDAFLVDPSSQESNKVVRIITEEMWVEIELGTKRPKAAGSVVLIGLVSISFPSQFLVRLANPRCGL
jgi:hypothetical protein